MEKKGTLDEDKRAKRKIMFAIILACTACIFVPYILISYKMYNDVRPKKPADYEWFEFADFKISLISGCIFLFFKKTSNYFFQDLILPYVKNRDEPEIAKKRAEKSSLYVFKAMYFIWM